VVRSCEVGNEPSGSIKCLESTECVQKSYEHSQERCTAEGITLKEIFGKQL
jgi:hypothetical protein